MEILIHLKEKLTTEQEKLKKWISLFKM